MWKYALCALAILATPASAQDAAAFGDDPGAIEDFDTGGKWVLNCRKPGVPTECSITQAVASDTWSDIWAMVTVVFNVYNEPELAIMLPRDLVDPYAMIGIDKKDGPFYRLRCGQICIGDFRIGKGWINSILDKKMLWIGYKRSDGAIRWCGIAIDGLRAAIETARGRHVQK